MTVELAEFQDSARKMLSGLGVPADEDKTWPHIIDLGWLLVLAPEDMGGLGQGLAAACALYTELGRSLAGAPYLPAMMAVDAVCRSGLADRESWVERLAGGEFVTAPLADCELRVTREGSGAARLSGVAAAVPSADKASHILVCASEESCVALVPIDRAGVDAIRRPTWDGTRRLYDVQFTDVPLDDSLVLAAGSAAEKLSARLFAHRDFALAADSIGGAEALLEMTVDYLQTRRQFRRPLAMFQALKHRCADLKVQITAAEALVVDSLSKLGVESADRDAELKGWMAKSLACSVFAEVGEEAVQMHGGIAMTSEHSCHFFFKTRFSKRTFGQACRTL